MAKRSRSSRAFLSDSLPHHRADTKAGTATSRYSIAQLRLFVKATAAEATAKKKYSTAAWVSLRKLVRAIFWASCLRRAVASLSSSFTTSRSTRRMWSKR